MATTALRGDYYSLHAMRTDGSVVAWGKTEAGAAGVGSDTSSGATTLPVVMTFGS